ncbi:hypothetical protein Pla123a_14560 [Posidoniimonas polymericola]|uniref:Inner membrane protein n=1 Tax=Posidoniimonas polymericola TaxID=2528002 RepID=A0A5C5YSD1_9BACT|nr:metal-dependent hydrolase [Posidoniimonas polymericola]TWT77660.1 hypothetical protein Pla123a_14560 [Posidoniimonas polymericola]
MTTPEHTLVGVHGAMALGLDRRLGWAAVVFAAVASNAPDLDGLPMLFDMQRFESGHRVWGHNVFAIALTSLLLAWSQARFGWIERLSARVAKWLPVDSRPPTAVGPFAGRPTMGWLIAVSAAAQLVHLACDAVVSGGEGLTDWPVEPFWPASDWGFVLPLVPWGDPGPTIVMMLGAIALAKFPERSRRLSRVTLAGLCLYLLARGIARGVVPL